MTEARPSFVWVDGALRPAEGPHLSVFDRGFQLGDGIFETLRAKGGHVTELAGARRPPPPVGRWPRDRAAGRRGEAARPRDRGAPCGRGAGRAGRATPRSGSRSRAGRWASRGLLPPSSERLTATIVIQAWPVAPAPAGHLERGLSLVASAVRRDPGNPIVTLKTTSRADYVFARLEARRAGAEDALFLTMSGHLSEATTANIFLVRTAADGVTELATPSLDCAILPGTTRSWLLRWAVVGGSPTGRGLAHAGRAGRRGRGLHLVVGRRDPARHPLQRPPDRRRGAWAVDAPGQDGAGGVHPRGMIGCREPRAEAPVREPRCRGVSQCAATAPPGTRGLDCVR